MTSRFFNYQQPINSQLEHNFDSHIKRANRNESVFSPLTYSPHYINDANAREKLKGNQTPYNICENNYALHNINNINNNSVNSPNKSNQGVNPTKALTNSGYLNENNAKVGSPLSKTNFNFNINSTKGNTLNYNDNNLGNQNIRANVLSIQGDNRIYQTDNYTKTPINMNYQSYNASHPTKVDSIFASIVNEIREKIRMKNNFYMEEIRRMPSPPQKFGNNNNFKSFDMNNVNSIKNVNQLNGDPQSQNSNNGIEANANRIISKTPNTVAITSGKANNFNNIQNYNNTNNDETLAMAMDNYLQKKNNNLYIIDLKFLAKVTIKGIIKILFWNTPT